MIFREATFEDAGAVARMHASSWQVHYRGILHETYLNEHVQADRLVIWRERLQHPAANQYVLIAEDGPILCGLACVYANEDPEWGSLVDNLHVLPDYQGRGLGARLLRAAARWAYQQAPRAGLYLWVYAANQSARRFYERMGGVHQETQPADNLGGGQVEVCRYVWPRLESLLEPPAAS